jgi:hypothetical protein
VSALDNQPVSERAMERAVRTPPGVVPEAGRLTVAKPAEASQLVGKVDVFAIHEEPLVEAPHLLERRPPHSQASPR